MVRRKGGAELQVRVTFEAARTAAQCLTTAYERLVPILCRPIRVSTRTENPPDVGLAEPPQRRRAERG